MSFIDFSIERFTLLLLKNKRMTVAFAKHPTAPVMHAQTPINVYKVEGTGIIPKLKARRILQPLYELEIIRGCLLTLLLTESTAFGPLYLGKTLQHVFGIK